jgi:hypothetical protein
MNFVQILRSLSSFLFILRGLTPGWLVAGKCIFPQLKDQSQSLGACLIG